MALSRGYAGAIDVLITDVVMPQKNGIHLVEGLSLERGDLKVLYISGYSAEVVERYGLPCNSDNFLQKPFTTEGLEHKIRQLIGQPADAVCDCRANVPGGPC